MYLFLTLQSGEVQISCSEYQWSFYILIEIFISIYILRLRRPQECFLALVRYFMTFDCELVLFEREYQLSECNKCSPVSNVFLEFIHSKSGSLHCFLM